MAENRQPRFFYGYIVVLAAFFIQAVIGGTMYTFGVFFKPLLTEFGWTRAMTSGAFSMFMLIHGLFYIVTGKVNDRFGPRVLLTVCGFFLSLSYLLMSQVSTIWQLYLFYGVIMAVGASGGFVPLISTLARWFVKRRGLMTGIAVSGTGVGMIILPPLANWLITNYNWRFSYLVVGVIALALIVIAAQFLRRDPSQIGQLPYGADEVKQDSLNSETRGLSFQQAIHTRQFWLFLAILFCFGFGLQTMMVHIVPHATDLGIPAATAANILAIIGGLTLAGRIIMGGAGDRIGNKTSFSIALIMMLIAFSWLLIAKQIWALYLLAAIFGFGYGGIAALQSPIVAELFGLSSHGVILGFAIFVVTIGSAIGPVMAGYIFDTTNSYQPAFITCVILIVTGVILTTSLRPTNSQRRNK